MCAPTGPAGLAGDTGPIGLTLITQAYANANIPEQTVATNAAVTYGTNTTVGTLAAGDTVQVVNGAVETVTLAESPGVTGSAGHLMFFRIADMGG
ncbi:hypothetical protein [Lacrimispora indolis]|uniref:hypothetical protein n=1 Tax=Lacrimispora indolis TaxID=69825 RepID=UPI00045E603B|nr:hypothetical protein [Lacrimispora indolis]